MAYDNEKTSGENADDALLFRPFSEPTEGKAVGRLWHKRLSSTAAWREKHPFADKQWSRALNLDRGNHWEENAKDEDASSNSPREQITVNLVGSTVRDFLAFLFKHTPEFLARPRRKEDLVSARLQQEVVNYFWREKRWKKQAKRAVRDMIVFGVGIVRTGWVFELDASATPDEHGQVEFHEAVKANEPMVRRINPAKFLFDPDAPENDLASARWVAEILHKSLSDILATERYDEDVRQKLATGYCKPTRVDKDAAARKKRKGIAAVVGDEEMSGESASEYICRIYDLWDKKYKRHYLLLDGVDEPLIAENWPYEYLDGFPYVMAVFDELNDEPFGIGLPWVMEDQQLELNRIRTSEFQHRRDYGRNRLQILENGMSPAQLAKLQAGDDGDIFVNVMDAIKATPVPPLPPDNYTIENIIKEDIRQLTGADQLSSGGDLPSRTSATEVNARSQYTGMKIEMRVETVDEFLTDITRQVLQHMKANLDVPMAVRIQGAQGQGWAMVSREDIPGDVDLEIQTVSAERINKDMLRQQAIQVMQHLATNTPNLQMAGYQVVWPRVMQWVFEEQFGIREWEEFVIPIPPQPGAPGAAGGGGAQAGMPGIPPNQQAAQQGAVNPMSMAQGAMGGLGG